MAPVAVQVKNEKGQANGFCRAGVRFGPDWGFYELNGEQLKRIKAEPALVVAESSAKLPAPVAVDLLRSTADLVLINEFYGDEERKTVVAAVEERMDELTRGPENEEPEE